MLERGEDVKGMKIMQKGMGSPEMVVLKVLGGTGNIRLPVIIVESWVTSALSVISHQEWEGTCIHYPHSCQTGPMILALILRMKQVLVV